jgi:uncharacterized protein DUF4328
MANTFRVESYRSAKGLSYFVIGLFLLQIGCMILSIGFSFGLLILPDRVLELDKGESLPIFFFLIGLIAIPELLFRIVTIVVFLIWEHRAFANLSPLKARNLEFSPGWAVGWWFIPFANLVKPYQAMKELWRESDPEFDPEMGFLSASIGVPSIFGFWWALWIISNISLRITDAASDAKPSELVSIFPIVNITSGVATIAAAGLIIWIVRDIVQRQEERYRRLGPENPFAQPQFPQTF